jgi:hypothetical protein
MKDLQKLKDALAPLQQIPGVVGCWLEVEEGDIVHVHTITPVPEYDLHKRIFDEYEQVEEQFPDVSFEFLTTLKSPPSWAEVVFLSADETPSAVAAVAS